VRSTNSLTVSGEPLGHTAKCRDTQHQCILLCMLTQRTRLQHTGHALQPRPRVNVLSREGLEGPTCLTVELDEDQVPDFEHVGVVCLSLQGGGGVCLQG
jgi:hypothetical protein